MKKDFDCLLHSLVHITTSKLENAGLKAYASEEVDGRWNNVPCSISDVIEDGSTLLIGPALKGGVQARNGRRHIVVKKELLPVLYEMLSTKYRSDGSLAELKHYSRRFLESSFNM